MVEESSLGSRGLGTERLYGDVKTSEARNALEGNDARKGTPTRRPRRASLPQRGYAKWTVPKRVLVLAILKLQDFCVALAIAGGVNGRAPGSRARQPVCRSANLTKRQCGPCSLSANAHVHVRAFWRGAAPDVRSVPTTERTNLPYHPLLASLADSEGLPQGRLTGRSHQAPACSRHQRAPQAAASVAVAFEAPVGRI